MELQQQRGAQTASATATQPGASAEDVTVEGLVDRGLMSIRTALSSRSGYRFTLLMCHRLMQSRYVILEHLQHSLEKLRHPRKPRTALTQCRMRCASADVAGAAEEVGHQVDQVA